MAKEKILIVEDDEDILELLRFNLVKEGYQVATATGGEEAIRKATMNPPDLVLLDLMLPGVDGLAVCKRLRAHPRTTQVPIIMVTAKGEDSDVVTGLEVGADDYLAKPFSPKVLVARIRNVLRRREKVASGEEAPLHVGGMLIHPGRHEVTVRDRRVNLTYTEFRVLHLLASRPGWVFSRQQIVDGVRGEGYAVTDRAVDVQVVGLRRKLGPGGHVIETVRGVGYRFKDT
jgi:two-component system, OmpR family, alkaline phosphatase synthesis response regulator PhoP